MILEESFEWAKHPIIIFSEASSPFAWNRENSDTDLVDSVCVGGNIVGVLADCVDVVLVGVVVIIVQVVVHVGHQIEHEEGEGHEVERIEAIVAFAPRATCSNGGESSISRFENLFLFSPCVAIEVGELTQDNSHSLVFGLGLEAAAEMCPLDQLRTFLKPSRSLLQAGLQQFPFAGDGVFSGAPPPGGDGPPGRPGSQGDSCRQGGEEASLA